MVCCLKLLNKYIANERGAIYETQKEHRKEESRISKDFINT